MASLLSTLLNKALNRTLNVTEDASANTQFWLAGLINQFGVSTPVISQIRTASNDLFDLPATGYITIPAKYGSWQISANGTYKYIADKANSLAAGQVVEETFTSSLVIGKETIKVSVKASITGTNDQPIATMDATEVKEDQLLNVPVSQGVLSNDRDVDTSDQIKVTAVRSASTGESKSVTTNGSGDLVGEYGVLTMKADGSYSYRATGAKAQALQTGQSATDTFTYTISDGKGGTSVTSLSIKIAGENDAPVATADTGNVKEDQIINVSASQGVLINDRDIDKLDQIKVIAIRSDVTNQSRAVGSEQSSSIVGEFGTLSMQADGSYTYQASSAKAQALSAGQIATDTFVYTIVDTQGACSVTTLSIKITGTNDVPSASADTAVVTAGDAVIRGASRGVLLNDKDADGDVLFVVGVAAGDATPVAVGMNTKVAGTYGELTMHTAGNYMYHANTDASLKLANGATAQDVFTYQISDGKGGVSTTTLTIIVSGEAADGEEEEFKGKVLGSVAVLDTATVTENQELIRNASTGLLLNDTDADGDKLTVIGVATGSTTNVSGNVATPLLGTYGSLTVASDGSYSYIPNTAAANALKAGETKNEVFSYKIDDGHGYTSTTTLSITITGANDQPVATVDIGSVTENTPLTKTAADGLLRNDTDVDGDRLLVTGVAVGNATPTTSNLGIPLVGTYGTLTVASDGSYSYVADTAAANALKVGQTQQEVFSYQISDGQGGTSITTLSITITGANDGPTANLDTGSVYENMNVSVAAAQGLLRNDADPDGDRLTITGVAIGHATPSSANLGTAVTGTYGTLTLASDGGYSYIANTKAVDALKVGETQQEIFSYEVSDGHGGLSITTLTLTVTGVNDAVTATHDIGSVLENGTLSVITTQGLLSNDHDPDGDNLTVTGVAIGNSTPSSTNLGIPLVGTYGTLTVASDGSYSYSANTKAADALKVGETQQEDFTYTVTDGQGSTSTVSLTLTVTGTNDAPVALTDSDSVNENMTLNVAAAQGLLSNDSDIDGDHLTVTGVGQFAPVSSNLGQAVLGTYGTLTVASDGSYSYVADKAIVDALQVGEIQQETFSYQITDGQGGTSTATLVLSIIGTNDQPLAQADAVEVRGNTTLSQTVAHGVLANDFDVEGDLLTVTGVNAGTLASNGGVGSSVTGNYGVLVLASDGSYSYTVNSTAAAGIGAGKTAAEVFTYQISDGHGGVSATTLTLLVVGAANGIANIRPVAEADFGGVDENASLSTNAVTGLLGNDIDANGDTLTVTGVALGGGTPSTQNLGTPLLGVYGELTVSSNGSYVYQANTAAADTLRAGETKHETFTYQVSDGHGGVSTATLTLTITGANDSPIATADTGSINENMTLAVAVAQGLLSNDKDIDGDQLVITGVGVGDNAVPLASNLGQAVTGIYGTLTITSDGSYSYVADTAAANALKLGETQQEVFTYQVSDGQGGAATTTLTLTVTGANDAPTATLDRVGVNEGGSVVNAVNAGLLANDTDPDQDALTVVAVGLEGNTPNASSLNTPLTGTYGTLVLASDGSYSYYANTSAANQLKEGEVQTESFVYQITDGKGGLSLSNLIVSVTGTNDLPVATADSVSVSSDVLMTKTATTGLLANDFDVDGDALVISALGAGSATPSASNLGQAISGTYGHLTLSSDGSYTYIADQTTGLSVGQTANDVFTYQINDGHGGVSTTTLIVNITKSDVIGGGGSGSSNGVPVASADVAYAVANATVSAVAADGVLSNDNDPNHDQLVVVNVGAGRVVPTLTLLGTPVAGEFGHLLLRSDGSYSYTTDTTKASKLANGVVATDTFTYVVSDGQGGVSSTTLTIAITGTNDQPVASTEIREVLAGSFFTTESLELSGTSGMFGGGSYGEQAISKVFDFGRENAGKTVLINVAMLEIDGWDTGNEFAQRFEHGQSESFRIFANGHLVQEAGFRYVDPDGGIDTTNNLGNAAYVDQSHNFCVEAVLDANGKVQLGFGGTIHQSYLDESWAVDQVSLTIQGTSTTQVDNFDVNTWENTLHLLSDHSLQNGVAITGIGAGVLDVATGHVGDVIRGAFGELIVQTDGSYIYRADLVSQLTPGQAATDVFSYTLTDQYGATSTTSIFINVWGTNEQRVSTYGGTVADVTEDTSLVVARQLLDLDTDAFVPQTMVKGTFGTFNLNSNGSWSYTLDNSSSVVQGLDSKDVVYDNFTVVNGNGTANTVTITVHGLDAIPEGTSKTIMYGNETGLYQVSASDFGFQANEDGTSLAGVRLLNFSSGVSGFILQNGQQQPLPINQFISVEDIEAGRVFLTGLSPNGVSTGNVSFEVQDSNGNLDPTPNMLTLNCVSDQSPLILDLDGNGVQTVGLAANIHFDINADGTQEQTGWVGANDAFLVVDRNQNGTIDDGSELFGNNTRLANGDKAANGFAALADYDSNQDGIIDANDEKFAQLKVWRDANQDGKSDARELFGLETAGVHSLSLDFTNSDKVVAGNRYAQVGSYTTATGATAEMTDVWFSTKTEAAKPSKLELRDLFHNDEHVPLPAAAANTETEANQATRPATTLGHTDPHAVDAHSGAAHQELHHLMQELLHKPHSLD